MNKVAMLGAAVVIVIALVVGTYLLQSQQSFMPTKFQYFGVSGGQNEGVYTVKFSLLDKNNNNGAASGIVTLKLEDSLGKILYEYNLTVKDSDFSNIFTNSSTGGTARGYTWNISSSNLNAGFPDSMGHGIAVIDFTAAQGNSFYAIDRSMEIPALPNGSTVPQCMYFFYSNSCELCQMAKTYIEQVQQDYPLLTVQEYEISNSSNYNLMAQYFNCHGVYNNSDYVWPVVFIGNETLSGYGGIWGGLRGSLEEDTGTACPVCDLAQ